MSQQLDYLAKELQGIIKASAGDEQALMTQLVIYISSRDYETWKAGYALGIKQKKND